MVEGISEISIDELRAQIPSVEPKWEIAPSHGEVEMLEPVIDSLQSATIAFVKSHNGQPGIIKTIEGVHHLEGIIAYMVGIEGGQEFALEELKKLKPNITWNRGGTLKKWEKFLGEEGKKYYTPEQLDTYVVDGGANGTLGKPRTALNFLTITSRKDPVFYTLTIDDLLEGLKQKAISLPTEHYYDLRVVPGENQAKYVDFCKDHLKIQKVIAPQK